MPNGRVGGFGGGNSVAETSASNGTRLRQGSWGAVLAAARRLSVFMFRERGALTW